MLKRVLTGIAIILTLTLNIAHSSDNIIDISDSLDTGSEISHSHIWKDEYDESWHWQRCLVCNAKENKQTHTLTSKNTMGTSCNSSNKKITSCSSCAYTKEEALNYGHTFSYLEHWCLVNTNTMLFWSRCRNCGGCYGSSLDGYKYYYSNGVEADPYSFVAPNTIKNQWGNSSYLSETTNGNYYGEDAGFRCNYTINNNTLDLTVEFKVPSVILNQLSASQLNDSTYVHIYSWVNRLASGKETTAFAVNPYYRAYNSQTNTITMKFSINLRNSNMDYEYPGTATASVRFRVPYGSGYRAYLYECTPVNLNTNFSDVLVNNALF